MHWLLYLRLTYLTAGTLLAFFWMVVILGHRRQRNFERIFFFLCLALVSFFGCSLLALNAQLYYGEIPNGLKTFAWSFLCLGLWTAPALALDLHVEYASLRGLLQSEGKKRLWKVACYLPLALALPQLIAALRISSNVDFDRPSHALGLAFQLWLAAVLVAAGLWQRKFAQVAPDREQKRFHSAIELILFSICILFVVMVTLQRVYGGGSWGVLSALVMILTLVPFGILIGNVQRFNFLQIGRQRNLIYAVFLTFLALLYLSLVRRASLWLDPYLPPEATAALLLFLPVAFFEPLQHTMRRLLRQTAQNELDHAHKLIGPINEAARAGDMAKLSRFTEKWIGDELQLAEVKIELAGNGTVTKQGTTRGLQDVFEIRRGAEQLGTLSVKPHGAMISGETYAALELVCEQLPAACDLCRSIEEKLRLERELAERDRLALVGQMAASISHNLKNPLGSIKTILQVQLESTELPATMRQETQMVLEEIGRLSAKLNQLLQFSRPGVRTGSRARCCDVARVADEVVNVFRREAEAKGVEVDWQQNPQDCPATASAEAVNDILSNVLLNAIEAADRGGHVRLAVQSANGHCRIEVEDDGPGIPQNLQAKVLQPFFTTKARGTGLGLAIVQRRLEEVGGTLETRSPVRQARGTLFRITLPVADAMSGKQERPR
jgi:signal transduction histidine kinase